MVNNSITEIDISEIPLELGSDLNERVKKWLALVDKGIRLVDKSKRKENINTYQSCSCFYCCRCLNCPYKFNDLRWIYNYTTTSDDLSKVIYNNNSIAARTCYNNETQTSNT